MLQVVPSNDLFQRSKRKIINLKGESNFLCRDISHNNNYSSKAICINSSYITYAFYVALFLGLPYYPQAIKNKNSKLPRLFKAWCISMCAVKATIYSIFISTGVLYIPIKLTVFTFYTLSCITALLTLYLVRYRHKITLSIRQMCDISHYISPDQKTGSSYCVFQISLLALDFCFMALTFKQGLDSVSHITTYNFLGRTLFEAYRISIAFTFLNGITTTGISIILCNNIFVTLRKVIHTFRTKLRMRHRVENYCRMNTIEDIIMFQKIAHCHRKLEESLSPVLLFISILCIVNFLNSFGILLTIDMPLLVTIATLIAMAQALLPFIGLTFSAAKVANEYKSLKECLVRCSEDVALAKTSTSDIPLFTILSDNVRATDFHFSAGDMFLLDKGLVLTVGGLIVTYGVVLFQMNALE